MTLRNHMETFLEGWRDHIPDEWVEILEGLEPDFEATAIGLDNAVDRPIGRAFPPIIGDLNVPTVFRMFRSIEPDQVRVVVVGQDPYPARVRATGRAFEDWAVQNGELADSFKRFMQSVLTCAFDNLQVDQRDSDWREIQDGVSRYLPDRNSMTRFFDRLAGQGVLFLNAAWTFTEFEWDRTIPRSKQMSRIQGAHQALWCPVTKRLVERLAARNQPTVFLFMGSIPQKLLVGAEGLWRQCAIIPCNHPGRSTFFHSSNPFSRVNAALHNLGEEPVIWWDPQRAV